MATPTWSGPIRPICAPSKPPTSPTRRPVRSNCSTGRRARRRFAGAGPARPSRPASRRSSPASARCWTWSNGRPAAAAPGSPSTSPSSRPCGSTCSGRWTPSCAPSTSCRPPLRSSTAARSLIFSNAAYQQLWNLDPAFLASRPSDSEVLDRLRAGRKLPEQADFRAWKADILSGYHTVESTETWWHLPDRRTLRVVINPNPRGGVTYLFDDVSERVQLESQVHALTRVQSETLDTLKEGVAVFGSDGRLKLHNRAFADDVGAAGRSHRAASAYRRGNPRLPPSGAAGRAVGRSSRRGRGAGRPAHGHGLPHGPADGSALECAAQPLPDGATLLTFIDVTASVSVARALTERNDALERASRLRDEFVHHVSYELRSPLTNVIGFAQLSGDETVGTLNPRQRDYADHIMRSSGALLAILNDILDLASIDTGSLELTPEDGRHPLHHRCRHARARGPACRSVPDGRHRRSGRYRLLRGGWETHPPDPVQPAVERGRLLLARARASAFWPASATTRCSSR